VNKKLYKLVAQKCYLCGESDISVLDVHRIQFGKDDGKYSPDNVVIICCLCHRKIHSGKLKIDKWYKSTMGRVLHWFDETGKEYFT